MKYNRYDIEDFLTDADFVEWATNGTEEQAIFFKDWLNSNPANKEKALLAKEFLFSLQRDTLEPSNEEMQSGLKKLLAANIINDKENSKGGLFISKTFWTRIAASLLLLITAIFVYIQLDKVSNLKVSETTTSRIITKQTDFGQKSLITLPDGSKVKLNAGTKIEFPEDFITNRQITLLGEAFFDVTKDSLHPFVISTDSITITVLGTSFNIASYQEDATTNVAVETGLVQVQKNSGSTKAFSPIFLEPEEMLIYNKAKNGHIQRKFEPLEIAWKDSILSFRDADFKEVMKQIERWYGFKLIISEADFNKIPKNINGRFKNKSIEKVLSGLQYAIGVDYEIDKKKKRIFITVK